MKIQSEIIYPESIMTQLTSFEFCPVFDKNRAKVRLCVCSGVLVTVTYGHDRFLWRSCHVWTIYLTWPNRLCISGSHHWIDIINLLDVIGNHRCSILKFNKNFSSFVIPFFYLPPQQGHLFYVFPGFEFPRVCGHWCISSTYSIVS